MIDKIDDFQRIKIHFAYPLFSTPPGVIYMHAINTYVYLVRNTLLVDTLVRGYTRQLVDTRRSISSSSSTDKSNQI